MSDIRTSPPVGDLRSLVLEVRDVLPVRRKFRVQLRLRRPERIRAPEVRWTLRPKTATTSMPCNGSFPETLLMPHDATKWYNYL